MLLIERNVWREKSCVKHGQEIAAFLSLYLILVSYHITLIVFVFLFVWWIVVIVWLLDLQLPMQSMPITTDVVSQNLDQGEVYNIMW
jgi:endonuclease/exonuclease/phosphatase (EEP) superfamily protein YafD